MMKGMLKRALGVVAAAAMAVTGAAALSGTANAAVGDIDISSATITINAGDEDQFTDRDLKYIKLAEYDKYEATGQPSVLSIYTVDNVRDFVEKALETVTNGSDPKTPSYDADKDGDPMAWIANHLDNSGDAPYSGVLRDFVTKLYDDANFVKLITSTMTTTTDTGASRTYTMANPGVYLIVDEGATTDDSAATQAIPMLVGTTIKVKKGSDAKVPGKPTYENDQEYGVLAGQVNLKNELTPVKKTVSGEGATPGVGDTRTYTITGKVPNWVGKDLSDAADPKPVFTFTDTPGKGQTVDFSSIKVYVDKNDNGEAEEGEYIKAHDQVSNPNGYVLTGTGVFASPTGSIDADFVPESHPQVLSSFTVTLTEYMKTIAQDTEYIGKPVVLTYDVTVNADAVNLEGDTITNEVEVNNNGSTNEASASLPKPQTITFRKTDRDDKALANAQFSLAKGSTFVKVAETKTGTTGSYIVDPYGVEADGKSTTTGEGDAAVTTLNPLVSDNNGMVTVAGLGEGTYTVTETHAPDGFIEVGLPSFTVTIGHDQKGMSTIKYDEANDPFDLITITGTDGSQTVSIKNVRNITQLPLTGAAGITLFMVLGLLIAGAGVTVYMKSRNIRKAMH